MWRSLLALLIILGIVGLAAILIPTMAARNFGPPADSLTWLEAFEYSARLLWADGLLTTRAEPSAPEEDFEVRAGESIGSVCRRLEGQGLVVSAAALRDYLIYTGRDTSVQAGEYKLSAAMSIIDIAGRMQDATPTDVDFTVLSGWRIEEIAAALPTSGLEITPEEFSTAARSPRSGFDFLQGSTTTEGFLYPGTYIVPRTAGTDDLIQILLRGFARHVDPARQQGFAAQGLSTREAVTLASIIEREAVHADEAPLIASVYLNRLHAGMKLDADPTVQYALGYNASQQTWWTNPLSLDDLQVDSRYNTYRVQGLPPAPISNPGAEALEAVASPAVSPYYFFSSACNGSGNHVFAETFEQHLANLCP